MRSELPHRSMAFGKNNGLQERAATDFPAGLREIPSQTTMMLYIMRSDPKVFLLLTKIAAGKPTP